MTTKEYLAMWKADDELFDSLDDSHETNVKVCYPENWLRDVNNFLDKAIDYDREMSYIDDVFSESEDGRW